MRAPEPIALQNADVRLEPLSAAHGAELVAAAREAPDEVFQWMHGWTPDQPFEVLLARHDAGEALTFVVRRAAGDVVGSSSYLDVSVPDARLEIGSTWYVRRVWRSEVNSATKLLLLGHAFDDLGAERVALRTDHLNVRSQRAIERLGAVREGVLRHHVRRRDGTWRDTVYYSVLRDEWPAVRDGLLVPRVEAVRPPPGRAS